MRTQGYAISVVGERAEDGRKVVLVDPFHRLRRGPEALLEVLDRRVVLCRPGVSSVPEMRAAEAYLAESVRGARPFGVGVRGKALWALEDADDPREGPHRVPAPTRPQGPVVAGRTDRDPAPAMTGGSLLRRTGPVDAFARGARRAGVFRQNVVLVLAALPFLACSGSSSSSTGSSGEGEGEGEGTRGTEGTATFPGSDRAASDRTPATSTDSRSPDAPNEGQAKCKAYAEAARCRCPAGWDPARCYENQRSMCEGLWRCPTQRPYLECLTTNACAAKPPCGPLPSTC